MKKCCLAGLELYHQVEAVFRVNAMPCSSKVFVVQSEYNAAGLGGISNNSTEEVKDMREVVDP
nr:hypothetical protein [Flaviflexus massiliensis]